MSIISPEVCAKLREHGLSTNPKAEFVNCFAFNGPVSLLNCIFVRSKINSFSYIGSGSHCITSSIGRYCSIGENVYLGMGQHDATEVSTSSALCSSSIFRFTGYAVERSTSLMKRRHGEETNNVTVGNDVWIGTNVTIPSDVKIGDGAVIGAGSVITKDVPPYAVVVGNNRLLKYRFSDEIISDLLELKWWNYNLPKMYQNNTIKGDNLYLDNPREFINYFKNADPATLVPLQQKWYYVKVPSDQAVLDKVSLVPTTESISLYYSPRDNEPD